MKIFKPVRFNVEWGKVTLVTFVIGWFLFLILFPLYGIFSQVVQAGLSSFITSFTSFRVSARLWIDIFYHHPRCFI